MNTILELPLLLQIILATGYAGYVIAQRDYRKNERKTDMLLGVLLMGLPTALIILLVSSNWKYLSLMLPPILGWGWAAYGRQWLFKVLRLTNASYENNEGDVWNTLSTRKRIFATQITVRLKNGNLYHCNNTMLFKDEPFFPFTMDEDGIAFYVTEHKKPDGEWKKDDEVIDADWGASVMYFPRADIAHLDIRFQRH